MIIKMSSLCALEILQPMLSVITVSPTAIYRSESKMMPEIWSLNVCRNPKANEMTHTNLVFKCCIKNLNYFLLS
jgi:hypothetical protein